MNSHERHLLGEHREHQASAARREESGATVELREEELAGRTQPIETGQVTLGTEVVEQQQTLEVPVTREEVTIERYPVSRQPSAAPIGQGETFQVPVRQEQVSVEKQAVVYEQVEVGKHAVQETRRVTDTVRKEVVDVDAEGNVETYHETHRSNA
jgi:uncharacterized protein (TIGR02271 family)